MLDFRAPDRGGYSLRGGIADRAPRLVAPAHALASEPAHARHLLGRPADPAQPARALEPRFDLAASRLPRHRHGIAVHDPPARRFLHLSRGVPHLLGSTFSCSAWPSTSPGPMQNGRSSSGKMRRRGCWAPFEGGSSSPSRSTRWARSSACQRAARACADHLDPAQLCYRAEAARSRASRARRVGGESLRTLSGAEEAFSKPREGNLKKRKRNPRIFLPPVKTFQWFTPPNPGTPTLSMSA